MKNEIKILQYLLNETGSVTTAGFSTAPNIIFSKDYCRVPRAKLKERDTYYIHSKDVGFYVSVVDYGANTYAGVALIDFLDGTIYSSTVLKPLTFGALDMPTSSENGSVSYADTKAGINFSCTSIRRYIKCDFVDFCQGKNLFANFALEQKFPESYNVSIPFHNDKTYFLLKRFLPGMSVSGKINFGGQEYSFNNTNACGYFDWQRYASPSRKYSCRLFCDTNLNRKQLSIHLANSVGDTANASENCFFYDGNLYPLGDISITGNETNLNRPFRFVCDNRAVEIAFHPKIRNGRLMSVNCEKKTIVFGNISGAIKHKGTGKLELINLPAHMEFSYV